MPLYLFITCVRCIFFLNNLSPKLSSSQISKIICDFWKLKNTKQTNKLVDASYSTVGFNCDLEKISRKLRFGTNVPYTFRINLKKIPAHSTLGTTKIHNSWFTAFFLHFNLKNRKNIISYVILCTNIRFCFEYLLFSFKCQYSNWMLWF